MRPPAAFEITKRGGLPILQKTQKNQRHFTGRATFSRSYSGLPTALLRIDAMHRARGASAIRANTRDHFLQASHPDLSSWSHPYLCPSRTPMRFFSDRSKTNKVTLSTPGHAISLGLRGVWHYESAMNKFSDTDTDAIPTGLVIVANTHYVSSSGVTLVRSAELSQSRAEPETRTRDGRALDCISQSALFANFHGTPSHSRMGTVLIGRRSSRRRGDRIRSPTSQPSFCAAATVVRGRRNKRDGHVWILHAYDRSRRIAKVRESSKS
jgi:hypothetical protein